MKTQIIPLACLLFTFLATCNAEDMSAISIERVSMQPLRWGELINADKNKYIQCYRGFDPHDKNIAWILVQSDGKHLYDVHLEIKSADTVIISSKFVLAEHVSNSEPALFRVRLPDDSQVKSEWIVSTFIAIRK